MGGITREETSELYRRYAPMLGRRSRLLLRDATLADDALQELALVLLRRGDGVRDADLPYRWLCRTLDRVCFDLLRRGRRHKGALTLDDVDSLGPSPGVDPDARRTILESLESLADDDERALAVLSFVDGCTQEEIAAELGVSRVTVNKRLQSIRSRLQITLRGKDSSSDVRFDAPRGMS